MKSWSNIQISLHDPEIIKINDVECLVKLPIDDNIKSWRIARQNIQNP